MCIAFGKNQDEAQEKAVISLKELYPAQLLSEATWWDAFDARSDEYPHGIAFLSDIELPRIMRVDREASRRVFRNSGIYGDHNRFHILYENGMDITSPELLQAVLTAGLVKYNAEKMAYLVPMKLDDP